MVVSTAIQPSPAANYLWQHVPARPGIQSTQVNIGEATEAFPYYFCNGLNIYIYIYEYINIHLFCVRFWISSNNSAVENYDLND